MVLRKLRALMWGFTVVEYTPLKHVVRSPASKEVKSAMKVTVVRKNTQIPSMRSESHLIWLGTLPKGDYCRLVS